MELAFWHAGCSAGNAGPGVMQNTPLAHHGGHSGPLVPFSSLREGELASNVRAELWSSDLPARGALSHGMMRSQRRVPLLNALLKDPGGHSRPQARQKT